MIKKIQERLDEKGIQVMEENGLNTSKARDILKKN